MQNEAFVASLLPEHAPLSTFRVMTASRLGLSSKENTIEAISCVFRAGRKGAATDHDSILFDVDVKTGKIGRGTTNMQWYRLGLRNCLIGGVRWAPPPDILDHPDCPGKRASLGLLYRTSRKGSRRSRRRRTGSYYLPCL